MFPQRVYHCQCVSLIVKLCLVNGLYLLDEICSKIGSKNLKQNIYYCKCGKYSENVIFSCRAHMRMRSLCEKSNQVCNECLKRYLKTAYDCCYEHTKFDIPKQIKIERKVLKLIVQKL